MTGASSGIGREIALELAHRDARLIVTARRADRLAQLASQIASLDREAHYLAGDIADADFRLHLLQEVQTRFGALDMLVNNAGIGEFGLFADADAGRLRRMMEVNFFAPAETIRAALPLLRSGTRPIIVNVCSVLGHRAAPNKSEYCASKFALHGFSDALRAELAVEKIDLLLVNPSTTESEFFDRLPPDQAQPAQPRLGKMKARAVARKTVRAMAAGKHEIVLSTMGKLVVWLDRAAPSLMNRLVAKFG